MCGDVSGPRQCHTERSNSETEKQIPCINTYVESRKMAVRILPAEIEKGTFLAVRWLRRQASNVKGAS